MGARPQNLGAHTQYLGTRAQIQSCHVRRNNWTIVGPILPNKGSVGKLLTSSRRCGPCLGPWRWSSSRKTAGQGRAIFPFVPIGNIDPNEFTNLRKDPNYADVMYNVRRGDRPQDAAGSGSRLRRRRRGRSTRWSASTRTARRWTGPTTSCELETRPMLHFAQKGDMGMCSYLPSLDLYRCCRSPPQRYQRPDLPAAMHHTR